jgi:hypothetical protein
MRKIWTREEIDWLKLNYANTPMHKLIAHLGRTKESIYGAAFVFKLKKSAEFLASPFCGRITPGSKLGGGTVFKKGHVPLNKGKKQIEYMTAESIEKTKHTRFQKGSKPHNTKEKDGTISVRKDSKGRCYQWIRISMGYWRELHRVVWEKNYGPIPKGYNIQFKDKNSLNCVIENLYMVDRQNQMIENTIHRYPAEIKQAIRTIGKLKSKIKTYEKHD